MNKKLEQMKSFLKNSEKDPSDLIVAKSEDEGLSALIGKKAKDFFRVYFHTKAGDLIGEWDMEGEFSKESLPIVWVSSEGSPNTVVAKNADEFLSLIPFGGGLMSRIPVLIKDYERDPDIFVSPDEEFNKEEIQNEYDYQAKQFSGHSEMVEFITQKLKIQLNPDPLQTIKDAIRSYPDLDKWIEDNLK